MCPIIEYRRQTIVTLRDTEHVQCKMFPLTSSGTIKSEKRQKAHKQQKWTHIRFADMQFQYMKPVYSSHSQPVFRPHSMLVHHKVFGEQYRKYF